MCTWTPGLGRCYPSLLKYRSTVCSMVSNHSGHSSARSAMTSSLSSPSLFSVFALALIAAATAADDVGVGADGELECAQLAHRGITAAHASIAKSLLDIPPPLGCPIPICERNRGELGNQVCLFRNRQKPSL